MKQLSLNKAKQVAVEAAHKAGYILLESLKNKELQIRHKSLVDLVTEADTASEKLIIEIIKQTFPSHNIISEEYGKEDKGSSYTWLIDPLDGTTNYAHGISHFSVSIALQKENDVIVGVVYDPCKNWLFSAVKSHGAYLNNNPITVSDTNELINALLATGFPYKSRESVLPMFNELIPRVRGIRRTGSAALDLCYVASGKFDGYWEFMMKPWDIYAGLLILKEAGGKVSYFNARQESRINIVASNGKIHEELLSTYEKFGSKK